MGAGRPKTLREPTTVAFRVERDLAEKAEKIAAEKGMTLSELLRSLVERLATKRRPKRRRS